MCTWTRRFCRAIPFLLLVLISVWLLSASPSHASGMQDITDLVAHPEQYDRQAVTVSGKVSNLQVATNRQGQSAYGFLLSDDKGTIKVVALGKVEIHEGEQVIVEGIFNRLRQAGRAIVFNEIKANIVQPLERLNPDLVG
ncbi:MAG: cytochrome c maturation protein CcmE [Nitrospiraceae bacterium]